MTTHAILKLIKQYHYPKLSPYDKKFVDDMIAFLPDGETEDGSIRDLNDYELIDVISQKKINHIKRIGKRFLIS